jgi:HrpA-like RNA helicase
VGAREGGSYVLDWRKLADLPVARAIGKEYDGLDEDVYMQVAATGSGKTMIVPVFEAMNIRTWDELVELVESDTVEAHLRKHGRKVTLRQPTRITAKSCYRAMSGFWGPIGLKVGIKTSEDEEGTIEDNDITIVTDGVLRVALDRLPKTRVTIIFDEIHWMMAPTEIELGLAKGLLADGRDIRVRQLSATVRPDNFVRYWEDLNDERVGEDEVQLVCDALDDGLVVNIMPQSQKCKIFYAEGVAYPTERRIYHPGKQWPSLHEFAEQVFNEGKRALVFMNTRREVSETSSEIGDVVEGLPTAFAHADVDIDDIIEFVEDNEPCMVFATVALATSVTLPFDYVWVDDNGMSSRWISDHYETTSGVPIDNNSLIQRCGRVGRVKPGVAILYSDHTRDRIPGEVSMRDGVNWKRADWDDIVPVTVETPLENMGLDQVVLTSAAYGIGVDDLDVMSDLNMDDMKASEAKCVDKGLISGGDGLQMALTDLGRKVNALPLDLDKAFMLATSSYKIMPLMISFVAHDDGVFRLFEQGQGDLTWKDKACDHARRNKRCRGYGKIDYDATHEDDSGYAHLECTNCYRKWVSDKKLGGADLFIQNHRDLKLKSAATLKAIILREAAGAQSTRKYARDNGISEKRLGIIMWTAEKIAKQMAYGGFKSRLLGMDPMEHENQLIRHLQKTRTLKTQEFNNSDRWGWSTNVWTSDGKSLWTRMAETEAYFFDIDDMYGMFIGRFRVIITKAGKEMGIWEDASWVDFPD